MDIVVRSGMAILIAVAGIALYFSITQLRLFALRRARHNPIGLEEWRAGKPTILYFTTPHCAPCKTIQHPALEELRAQYGDRLQIVEVDASQRTDLANHWGVLSVPTTFILDTNGQPRHVNNGIALASKLRQQLREFAGLTEPSDPTRKTPRDEFESANFTFLNSCQPESESLALVAPREKFV